MKNILLIAAIALVAYWFFVLKKGTLGVPTTMNVDWGQPTVPYVQIPDYIQQRPGLFFM